MLWSSSGRKWKLVRGLFIFIAAHKSSLAAAGSCYLPPEVAVWLPVDRPLTALHIYIYILKSMQLTTAASVGYPELSSLIVLHAHYNISACAIIL